jgi:hypothetical protein
MSFIDEIRDSMRESGFLLPAELSSLFTADEFAAAAAKSELNSYFEDCPTLLKLYIVRMYLECASANDAMSPTVPFGALLSPEDKRSMRKVLLDTLCLHVVEGSDELQRGRADRALEITTRLLCASIHGRATLEPESIMDTNRTSPLAFGHIVRSWWNMQARTRIVVEDALKALMHVVDGTRARGTPDHLVRKEVIEGHLL